MLEARLSARIDEAVDRVLVGAEQGQKEKPIHTVTQCKHLLALNGKQVPRMAAGPSGPHVYYNATLLEPNCCKQLGSVSVHLLL